MELTLKEALQRGVEAHRLGQVQDADRYYTAILQSQPNHPDANHNLGVLAVGLGKILEALPYFEKALKANPGIGQFWLSYIDALLLLERTKDAKNALTQARESGAEGEAFDELEKKLTSNILDTRTVEQALMLAKKKTKEGSPKTAETIYQHILGKYPQNKKALAALRSLSSHPGGEKRAPQDPPHEQLQALINLQKKGRYQQALAETNRILQHYPGSAPLLTIRGDTNAATGQLQGAIADYERALEINPDYAASHLKSGNARYGLGDLEGSIDNYKQAIKIKPDYVDAYNNMGNVLYELGSFEAAVESFKQALKIDPNYSDAYTNMGIALRDSSFSTSKPDLYKPIAALLDQKTTVRPKDIAHATISLLKLDPRIQKVSDLHAAEKLEQSLIEAVSTLGEVSLLLKLMSVCPLPDLQLESILTDLRRAILLSIDELPDSSEALRFQSALALQCFTNEYVYVQTDAELERLRVLATSIEEALSQNEQPKPEAILCLASYVALHEYEWCDMLASSDAIAEVTKRQVTEPNEEKRIRAQLPILNEISDSVSSAVREQYEGNPYPRWVNLSVSTDPVPISQLVEELNLKLFDKRIITVEAPNILVAGCGTGQHPMGTAARFRNSKVLAVDLSLSSLAYAKRKTLEFDLKNLDYMQADILELEKLDRQFDLIESVGVLHHMDNPLAGWKALTTCLKPGGLMKIGLYSDLARHDIASSRAEIEQAGVESSDSDMRAFRGELIHSGLERYGGIFASNDFYSLSSLRDLLFHVQEHRFTLPQIQSCLKELGLEFCGFEMKSTASDLTRMRQELGDPYDLSNWSSYEEANPYTFAGMYQFWCQKLA